MRVVVVCVDTTACFLNSQSRPPTKPLSRKIKSWPSFSFKTKLTVAKLDYICNLHEFANTFEQGDLGVCDGGAISSVY